jgi:hypothetical protein
MYTAFVRNNLQTKLLHVFEYKVRHVKASQQASERPFLTSVITRVSMRNVLYYRLSEYAQSIAGTQ